MTSVNTYTSYTPATCHLALTRIREFLIANGWTEEEYVSGMEWLSDGDGTYSWQLGGDAETFLDMSSQGYNGLGNQDMRYRFWVTASGADPLAEYLYVSLVDPTDPEVDENVSTTPVLQKYVTYLRIGIPTGTGLTIHAFDLNTGFPTFATFILQLTDYFNVLFAIGCPDLFVTTDEVWGIWGASTALAYYTITGHNLQTRQPLAKWNNYRGGNTGVWQSNHYCGGTYGWSATNYGFIAPYGGAVQLNAYAGRRSFIKPIYFCTDDNDQLWPVGSYPWYYCRWPGLDLGETITYGGQQYVVFPDGFTSKDYGIGMRIA